MLRLAEKYIAPITDQLVDGVSRLTGEFLGKPVINIKFEKAIASHSIPFAIILGVGFVVAASTPLAAAIPAGIVAALALSILCHIKLAAKHAQTQLQAEAIRAQTHVLHYDPQSGKYVTVHSVLHTPTDEELENKFKELLVTDSHGFGQIFSGKFIEEEVPAEGVPVQQATIIEEDI